MIVLSLPLPVAAESYWKRFVPKGAKMPKISVSREGRMYRELVKNVARQAGVSTPLAGRVSLSYVLYPKRPNDWREYFRHDPECWDDMVKCESLDSVGRVLVDALRGVAFENDRRIRKIEAERAVPDGHPRVEIRIEKLAGELEKRRSVEEVHETRHGMAYFYPPGTIVATPSGRQAVVLRYLHGTGKADTFERAICRYLDSTSERECVTLQPRFLRRIS
ncbi:MAG: RusA family crossover junction endodeoxyribonuclease [Oxalobacter sp.]|nr:RusA family crossover junction endodeoxyribonuclease [Oxalobacter sp.]